MLEFAKIQGNGNDFVVIDNRDKKLSERELSDLAQKVCERRQSLGGDGLLVVEVSKTYDFKMRLFNSDGSEAEMCGNGARCIARYAQKKMLAGEQMVFETLAGAIRATVQGAYVELDMGEIHLSEGFWGENLTVEGMTFPFVYLVVGVPHCVLFVEDLHAAGRIYTVTSRRVFCSTAGTGTARSSVAALANSSAILSTSADSCSWYSTALLNGPSIARNQAITSPSVGVGRHCK